MVKKRSVLLGIALLLVLAFTALAVSGYANQPGTQIASSAFSTPLPATGMVIPHQAGTMLTTEQVRKYVTTHTFWVGPTTTGKMFTIEVLQLMTAKQAYQKNLIEYLSVPDNAPIYYVKARGPFKPIGLHLAPGVKPPTQADEAYEVWDPYSGRLLQEGL